jgi:hypothetical protein
MMAEFKSYFYRYRDLSLTEGQARERAKEMAESQLEQEGW